MASPAPLLRPPIPGGGRSAQGHKLPRLGLAIPPSPGQRPVNSSAAPPLSETMSGLPPLSIPGKQHLPKLSVATPMGTRQAPQEGQQPRRRGPPLVMPGGGLTPSGGSSDDSAHSRTNSFGAAGSVSTASSYSMINFADVLRDPDSAAYSSSSAHSGMGVGVGMEREGSGQGQSAADLEEHLKKLTLEKGGPLDAEDLDDMGWKAAKREGTIMELG
ncbi:Protein kinase C signaling pathway involved MAPKK protein, partial [Teratosphaeriaceae sp. CCFEE 6253]